MTICDIAQFYSPLGGGVKRYLQDKQRFLKATPGARHLMIIPSHRNACLSGRQVTVYEIKSPRLIGSRSYRMLLDRSQILDIVSREKPDIVEVGDPYRTAWIGLEAARKAGVPVIAFYHSDFPRAFSRTVRRFCGDRVARGAASWINGYIRRLYNRMDATVVASSRIMGELERTGIKHLVNIPLGTDLSVFFPKPSRAKLLQELEIDSRSYLMVYVGRLAREKNIRNLIASLDHLQTGDRPAHLLLVGDGELGEFVREQTRERTNLSWMPYCESASRLTEYYSAADLFVHAGRWETFGIVSVEAQACGARVLGVKGGGLEESLDGESPLIMAENDSPEALAAGIERCRALEKSAMDRQARRARIASRFSIDTTFLRMAALYRHLIAGLPVEKFSPELISSHELSHPPVPVQRS